MYRRQNQSQQPKTFTKIESENPAYDRQSVYDDITDLDKETYGPYDVPECYDELKDPDNGANDTYDHPEAVPGPSTPNPYEGLNAGIYDQPDTGPALPDRPPPNPYQNVNQETTKPNTTHAYLELINVDDEPNETAVHQEPSTTHAYLELIHVVDEQNQMGECWSECCVQSTEGSQELH